MYVQEEHIQPGDKVLFVLKKNDFPLNIIVLFFCTVSVGIFLAVIAWVEGDLGIRILLVFTYVFAFVSVFLATRQHQKTELVLTNRRLLLSQGLFTIKRYNIPISEIEAVVGKVILSKGARISLSFIFNRNSIENLAGVFDRVHKSPGLTEDIKALWHAKTQGKLPGSAGSGETLPGGSEEVPNSPEEIIFTYRKSKSAKLIEISVWIFLIVLDILGALINAYSGSFFKLLGLSMLGLLLIVGLFIRLQMFKYFIVLTNKNLVIRSRFIDAGAKKIVSTKTIPLISIREIRYPDDLHIVLKNGEQLRVSVEAKPRELRRLADHIARLNKRS